MLTPHELLCHLDPEQQAVAQATRGALCVRAGAGTGKTRAITYRIAYAVATGVVQPQNILALTFTKRAAGQMRSRLRSLGVGNVQARTFHSAALSQLRYFWPHAIGGHVPEIQESKMRLVSTAATQVGMATDLPAIKDAVAEIEWAKVSLISPQEYPQRAQQDNRSALGEYEYEDIARLMGVYEDLKTERGVIDFEDVILILIGILLDRPDIARNIRDQYRYFVVDEYQDVSPMQHRLLQLWLGNRRDLCVVGDSAQTIYTFTGASSIYLENFAREFPRAQEIVLDRNYRSTPQILECANALVSHGIGATPIRLRAMAQSGSAVEFHTYLSGSKEAQGIAQNVLKLAQAGRPLSSMAVLYRTKSQASEFETALSQAGIPYVLQEQESFFQRKEIREAMAVLHSEASVRAAAASARLPASDSSASASARLPASASSASASAYSSASVPDCSPASRMRDEKLESNGKETREGEESFSLVERVENVLLAIGWRPEGPMRQGAGRERWESLEALRTLAQQMWDDRHATLREFVAELEDRAQLENPPSTNALTLCTIHAAKGLEWDVVFLAGMAEGLLPISYADTQEKIEEEKRLAYVGVTRARAKLYISCADEYGNRSGNRISRFFTDLWPADSSRSTRARQRASHEAQMFEKEDPHVRKAFARLCQWRAEEAKSVGKPAYMVFHDSVLRAIARECPRDLRELGAIRGVGTAKLTMYGVDVLRALHGE